MACSAVHSFLRHVWNRIYSMYIVKVKGEVVPVHNTKACRGTRGIDPLILKLGSRWS